MDKQARYIHNFEATHARYKYNFEATQSMYIVCIYVCKCYLVYFEKKIFLEEKG